MNKQTLFVKVSDTSGADMLSQNPYLQILTGGGYWNSHSAKESGLLITSSVKERKGSQNSSPLNLKSIFYADKRGVVSYYKCSSVSGQCSPVASFVTLLCESKHHLTSHNFEARNSEMHASCHCRFKNPSFATDGFQNQFLKFSPNRISESFRDLEGGVIL